MGSGSTLYMGLVGQSMSVITNIDSISFMIEFLEAWSMETMTPWTNKQMQYINRFTSEGICVSLMLLLVGEENLTLG